MSENTSENGNLADSIPLGGVLGTLGEAEVSSDRGGGSMARKAGWVGGLTFISRLFGLLRDSAIAYVLGTGVAADAFYVAFRIPNLLRRLLAEGNLTMSFVPVFTESLHRSKKEAQDVHNATFTFMVLVLGVVSALGLIFSAQFVELTAFGFKEIPDKFALTVQLTRITFPYIFLVSLGALMMGVLNARKEFTAPAFAPVLMNLGMIAGALWLSRYFPQPAVGIAWGVLLGGTLQVMGQVPAMIREGFFPRFNFNFKNPAVVKILKLMAPSIYGSAVYQINLLAITFMASFLPTGSVSFLWYADRVVEFPLGIFAVSFATVALPTLSEHWVKKDFNGMKKSYRQALAMIWLVNIPAAVGLIVLAEPILSLLFYRGDFTRESTHFTAQALQCFAIGLPFVSATRLTSTAFYAIQEAKKPVRAANIAVLVNLAVGALLLFPLQHRGLALGVASGSLANFILQIFDYRKMVGPLGLRKTAKAIGKIFAGALLMGGGLILVQHYWDWTFASMTKRAIYLFSLMFGGMLLYGLALILFRSEEAKAFLNLFRRRLQRSK